MKNFNLIAFLFVAGFALSSCSKKSSDNNSVVNPNYPTYPSTPGYPSTPNYPYPCGNTPCNTPPPCVSCQPTPPPCYYNCGGGGVIWDDPVDHDTSCKQDTTWVSEWKKVWGNMKKDKTNSAGDTVARGYVTIKTPKCGGTYYLSFKGDYTGCDQIWEDLRVYFADGNKHPGTSNHYIRDLNDSHKGAGEITESCKVKKGFILKGNTTYTIFLQGARSSVNHTYLRLTGAYNDNGSNGMNLKVCN